MKRVLPTLVVIALAAAVLAGCGSGSNPLGLPCNPQPNGAICVKVFNDHLHVRDVIVYLSASDSPLAGKTWRLVLTAGGKTYPGERQHGVPPLQVFCKDSAGQTITTGNGCHDTLADQRASIGEFPGFNPPMSLNSAGDVCVAEQIETNGTWHTEATPARVCSSVS
jgi:hypothetical protein